MASKFLDLEGLRTFYGKLKTKLASYSLDSSVVHNEGDETIAGTKTFSSPIAASISGKAATAGDADTAAVASKSKGVFLVIPDQTTQNATLTASVTGITEYFPGLMVAYRAPFNTAASSTLNINSLGAKPIYYGVNTASKDYYPANRVILLLYETTTVSTGCWKMVYSYDSNNNNYDRRLHNNNVVMAAAVAANTVIVGNSAGYRQAASGVSFDISYPVLVATEAKDANAVSAKTYEALPSVNLQTTKASWTGTQYAMAFLVGTLSGSTVTIDSSVFTTTVPSSADGKVYIPIGLMASTYQVYFASSSDMYQYSNGSFHKYGATSAETGTANGTIKIDGTDVAVKGLGSAAYENSTAYSASDHIHGNVGNDGTLGTANAVVVTDGDKKVLASASITTTELGYLDGVSSNIQTQFSGKVAKAGDTMTGNLTIKKSSPQCFFQDTRGVKGTAPSSNIWNQFFYVRDNNNVSYGGLEHGFKTTLENRFNVIVYKGTTTTTSENVQISVGYDGNGNWFTYAPTPAAADNSTKMATTAWARTATGNFACNAASATKATQDASGNVITTTYATKSELPSDYVGATSSANGTHGLVPVATSTQKDYFLCGDGTWKDLTSITNSEVDALFA